MPKNIRPAKVVSIIQRKGGSGKTTVMHHVAAGLVLKGYEVLAIEADDNPRLRAILSGLEADGDSDLDARQTAYNLFAHPEEGTAQCTFAVYLDRLWENIPSLSLNDVHNLRSERGWAMAGKFDYIPGSEHIKDIEDEYARRTLKATGFDPDHQLARAIALARTQYDVIVIDSPPSLTSVLRNILAASTHTLIPTEFDFASIEDYKRTLKVFKNVCLALKASNKPAPASPLVVFNRYNASNEDHVAMYRAYTGDHQEVINGQTVMRPAMIREQIVGTIPYNAELLNRAAMRHRSLHQYAPKSDIGISAARLVDATEKAIGLV